MMRPYLRRVLSMPIKAIVFDMDDTLYSEKDYVYSGFKQLDHWVLKEFGKQGFLLKAWNCFCTHRSHNIFNQVLHELQIPYDQNVINHMVNLYRNHKPNIQLYEDAAWILDSLEQEHIKIGLISDGFLHSQQHKLNALNIKDKFHAIVLSDELGRDCWKPSVAPYERICLELGVSHHECLYIGDNIMKDFITAKALGWTTIHIDREGGLYSGITLKAEYEADYKIHNLRELYIIGKLNKLWTEEVIV